jgi:hypothetical protein
MSTVLALARDFIERMSNPVFGLSTNEEYSLEFGQLLQSEDFAFQLRRDIESLRDPVEMTSHGWLWILGWARSNRIQLQDHLLLALFEQWSSVFMKTAIVDLVTAELEGQKEQRSDERESQFLEEIVVRATEYEQRREDRREAPPVAQFGRAEATLIALLQVGRPATLQAAQGLLRRRWTGQERLVEFFWSLVDSLEDDTRAAWLQAVNPPERWR